MIRAILLSAAESWGAPYTIPNRCKRQHRYAVICVLP